MARTRVSRRIRAAPTAVYAALLDAEAVARWRAPDDMTAVVHAFEPTVGGYFRVSLTYVDPARPGKSSGSTDTYHGRFTRLIRDREVVEMIEFESADPAFQAAMTMTTAIETADDGCIVTVTVDGLPDAVPVEANELGTRMALAKLAALLEPRPADPVP